MSDDLEVNVVFEGNADELAAQLAAAIERGVGRAIREIQSDMAQIFAGSQQRRSTSQAAQGADRVADSWERVRAQINEANTAFRTFTRTMATAQTPDEALREYIRLLQAAERSQEELRIERDRAADDPEFGKQIRTEARLRQQAASAQADTARTLTTVVRTELAKQAEAGRVAAQGETTRARAEASERIVIAQQEGSRIVAETRAAGQRRIAIMQFVFNQIRALERGLGAVIRGTANALGATARGIGASLSRIGGLFRRADAQMAGGLAPALGRREGLLRSSMNRQERIIQSSVQTQSLQIQRLERRLSTGVLGAATGRSSLGALFGGGLAIGGGFALVSGLRNMISAAQDFEQGLAVLQAQLQLSGRTMERVRERAIDLGNDLTLPGVSAVQGAEAINLLTKQFGSLGKRAVRAALAAAKGVLQLSRATKSSAEESAQVVGAAINVFGINAREAVSVADQVTGALTKAAGVGFNDFALAFKQGATVFAQFQVPAVGAKEALIDFNTAIAVLARGGLVGSDAGTSLKQFFLQANRGTKDSVKNLKALTERAGETGTAFFDAAGKARPLSEALAIMRKGLQGLSDQERSKTLQKIFGSDAIRAANILLGTSEKTFDTIEEGVRRSGVAAEIAAAQNQGLRGAMDALNSVIETQVVKIWRPLNKALGNVVLTFANFFNLLLTAEEGPFKIVRDGLIGIAVGLGAVLAVKLGVEVIRLLGAALPALLTPMGLVVTAAGLLGGAFFILRKNSPAFAEAIGRIGEILRNLVAPAIEFVQGVFQDFVEFIKNRSGDINAIGRTIGDFLLTNVQRAVDFIQNTVIPTLRRFADFVIGTVIPVIGRFFVRAWETAGRVVENFWRVVEPIIRPAIDGFRRIGESVRDMISNFDLGTLLRLGGVVAAAFAGLAVAGPVGAVVAGAGAAIALLFGDTLGQGLLDTLGNIGATIRDALRGPMESAIEFITGFFTADRLEGMVRGFLDVLEEIAFHIANLATDPAVAAAILALGAAGVVMAARLVEGFARGLIDNFGEVFDLFVNKIVGIEGDFSQAGERLGTVLLTGFVAIFAGTKLLGLLRAGATKLGLSTGQAFADAITKGTTQSLTVGGAGLGAGPKGLLQGLLGGPAAIAGAQRDAARISGALRTEFNRNLHLIAATGRSTFDLIKLEATQGLEAATRASRRYRGQAEADFGAARLAGLGVNAAVRDIGTSIRGLNFRGVKTGLQNILGSLQGQGRNIGVAAGGTIASSLGAAFGAQMAVESQSGGGIAIGLATMAASIAAAASLGVVPGVVAAGVGVISFAVQALSGEASTAEEAVKGLGEALAGISDSSGQFEELKNRVKDMVSEFEGGGLVGPLRDAEFNFGEFVSAVLSGSEAVEENLADLRARLEAQGVPDLAIRAIVVELENLAEGMDDERLKGDALREMSANARNLTTDIGDAKDRIGLAFGEVPVDNVSPVVEGLMTQLGTAEEQAVDTREEIERLFGRRLPSTLQNAMDDLIIGLQDLPSQLRGIRLDTALGQAQVRQAASEKSNEFLVAIAEGIESGEITALPQIRANRRLFLEQVRAAFQLKDSAGGGRITRVEAEVIAQIEAVIDGPAANRRFRRLLRNLGLTGTVRPDVTVLPQFKISPNLGRRGGDLMTQIRESVTGRRGSPGFGEARGFTGGGGDAISVPVEIEPEVTVRGTQGGIGTGITEQIAAGIEAGGPRINQALNSAIGRALRSGASLAGTFAVAGASAVSAFAQGLTSASGLAVRAATTVGTQATQGAAAGSVGMVIAGGAAATAFAGGVASGSGAAASAGAALASGADAGASGISLYDEGQNAAVGFALGVASGTGSAYRAGYALGQAAEQGTRDALASQSPSRVFRMIGRDIGAGLALGLKDSKTDISSAVSEAISNAIEEARRAIPDDLVAMAEAGAGLFEILLPSRIPGGPTEVDVDQARSDALDAIRAVGDAVREANQANREIERAIRDQERALTEALKQVRERLAEAIQNAFGRGAAGLDVTRQRINLGGLRGQVRGSIQDLLEAALERREELLRRSQDESLSAEERARARELLAAQDARIARLRGEIRNLNINTATGRAAANVILDYGQQIRDLGSTMLAQGASAEQVSRTMARYRDQLIQAALAQGVSRERLRELIQQLGLTDAQLERFVRTSESAEERARNRERELREATQERIADLRADILANITSSRSLSQATAAGRQNRRVFIDAFQNIRRFGVELLRSGTSAEDAVAQMRVLRNNLVRNATAMGFNSSEIQELLRMLGLTDAQLAEFVAQLGDLNDELERGSQNLPEGGSGPFIPTQQNVFNLALPFGDPEAVAFTVANRIAFAGAG